MFCIIYGTPSDGFRIIGPFPENDDALLYLETDGELNQGNAWIAPLDTPAAID